MREKLADRFEAHAALETEGIEGRHHQTREPTSAVLGFPQPRLRVAVSACHGLFETMHTALGNPRLTGKLARALRHIVTKRVENQQTFRPKSHVVGPLSYGWLKSRGTSALPRSGPTTD